MNGALLVLDNLSINYSVTWQQCLHIVDARYYICVGIFYEVVYSFSDTSKVCERLQIQKNQTRLQLSA